MVVEVGSYWGGLGGVRERLILEVCLFLEG